MTRTSLPGCEQQFQRRVHWQLHVAACSCSCHGMGIYSHKLDSFDVRAGSEIITEHAWFEGATLVEPVCHFVPQILRCPQDRDAYSLVGWPCAEDRAHRSPEVSRRRSTCHLVPRQVRVRVRSGAGRWRWRWRRLLEEGCWRRRRLLEEGCWRWPWPWRWRWPFFLGGGVNNIASSNAHITWYPRVGLAILGRYYFRCLKSWYFFAFALPTGPLNLEFSYGIRSGDVMNMTLAPVMSSFW
jgi:hypothetical protein